MTAGDRQGTTSPDTSAGEVAADDGGPPAVPAGLVAVARFRVAESEGPGFEGRAQAALDALAARPGYLGGDLGRAVDDPTLWSLVSTWVGVGAYRRALSAYDVRVAAVPLLALALDEPGAYEVVRAAGTRGSSRAADADAVGVGRAASPSVATTLDRPANAATAAEQGR